VKPNLHGGLYPGALEEHSMSYMVPFTGTSTPVHSCRLKNISKPELDLGPRCERKIGHLKLLAWNYGIMASTFPRASKLGIRFPVVRVTVDNWEVETT
jgi:hypothetical protein